jgi:hypothetical protein
VIAFVVPPVNDAAVIAKLLFCKPATVNVVAFGTDVTTAASRL